MWTYYYSNQPDELMHYGILGMKWGVRRSSVSLGKKANRLSTKNEKLLSKHKNLVKAIDDYKLKSNKIRKHNTKHENVISKQESRKAKYDKKAKKELNRRYTNTQKLEKYQAKSAKAQRKITKATKRLKHDKWDSLAKDTEAQAIKVKRKIEKNQRLLDVLNKTISAIDNNTIKQGRYFMRYED